MTATDKEKIQIAANLGIKMPFRAMKVSHAVPIPYGVLCAFLEQESGGGQNIYGHDPGWFCGKGPVTRENYAVYKAGRAAHNSQGVGPMQLTYYAFQDRADALGGCWRPYVNMLVGAQILKEYFVKYKTWHLAAYHYNGSGEAAERYADAVTEKIKKYVSRMQAD